MVAISIIKSANASLPSILPNSLTAVFLGATSGIGQSTLKQFAAATKDKSPRVYIVGRSAAAGRPLVDELKQINASATFEFLEYDVSLLRDVDRAVRDVVQRERKVDLLFMSVGFISFEGRKETDEGLEPSMTTRFYSRIRTLQLLLPLLLQSPNPHVVNILAGGQEGPLTEDDLDLARPGNYSFNQASIHSATVLTLVLERFASENPSISFVHAFPGLTATPVLTRGSSGVVNFLLKWIVAPVVNTLFAASVGDVGARALFYATNARFTVEGNAGSAGKLPEGLERARMSPGGVFLVDAKSESADNEKVLGGLRVKMGEKVWDHVGEVFGRVVQGSL